MRVGVIEPDDLEPLRTCRSASLDVGLWIDQKAG